jgi:hypothetical protein
MSWPGARKVLPAFCAPAADGEPAAAEAGAVDAGAVDAGAADVEPAVEAAGLPDDPHAVASNERHAITPAAATRRDLDE